MTKKVRIVLAQLNLHVGNIKENVQKHIEAITEARDKHRADLIIFPELSITGYPAEDWLLRPRFVENAMNATHDIANASQGIYVLFGCPEQSNGTLYNTAILAKNGHIHHRYAKQCLPNHGVFDEYRYFTPGDKSCVFDLNGTPTAILVCHDVWNKAPIEQAANKGARLVLCSNASPFITTKHEERLENLSKQAKDHQVSIVYNNLIGGQDDLVFDGGSMVLNSKGTITDFAGFNNETLLITEIDIDNDKQQSNIQVPDSLDRIYDALVLATKDYISKNNIQGVLVGLSGGIDSALTLTIAADAIGSERVHAVTMPSSYTADISNKDAELLADRLSVDLKTIPITDGFQALCDTINPFLDNQDFDVTHENIQARCRAIILMALSNKSGNIVLTTGNRSELAVGYCTLYGDMAGGFAPLKDIPKSLVYALAKHRNKRQETIPLRTITRAPTAELSPDQKDEDTLPPYPVLDQILEAYLNHSRSIEDIVALGFDKETVTSVVRMIRSSEYKRKQATIGPIINNKSFGRDWRYPITNGYRY